MTDYTSEIDAWYQAIQYRTPPASELASFNAQLQQGIITTAQAVAQIEASTYTQNYVDPVIREYQAAFGRVPDQARRRLLGRPGRDQPRQPRPAEHRFRQFGRVLRGLRGQRHDAGELHARHRALCERPRPRAGRRRPRLLVQFRPRRRAAAAVLRAIAGIHHRHHPLRHRNSRTRKSPATRRPAARFITKRSRAALPRTPTPSPTARRPPIRSPALLGGQTVTGTVAGGPTGPISSTEAAGNSNVIINAALGLNNFQSIVFNGINNVLNADYTPGVGLSSLTNSNFPGSNFDQSGLNIQGVQTWNIQADGRYAGSSSTNPYGTIIFTGDGTAGNLISGLQTVNFNDNSGSTSLLIGDNSEPVQKPNGANGFAINVSNAVGNGNNGVDVDIAAQAFTGKDTINVGAYIVGGFPEMQRQLHHPALRVRREQQRRGQLQPELGRLRAERLRHCGRRLGRAERRRSASRTGSSPRPAPRPSARSTSSPWAAKVPPAPRRSR